MSPREQPCRIFVVCLMSLDLWPPNSSSRNNTPHKIPFCLLCLPPTSTHCCYYCLVDFLILWKFNRALAPGGCLEMSIRIRIQLHAGLLIRNKHEHELCGNYCKVLSEINVPRLFTPAQLVVFHSDGRWWQHHQAESCRCRNK